MFVFLPMRNMTHPEKPCVLEQNNAKTEVAALMSVAVAEEDEKALAVAANNQGRFPISLFDFLTFHMLVEMKSESDRLILPAAGALGAVVTVEAMSVAPLPNQTCPRTRAVTHGKRLQMRRILHPIHILGCPSRCQHHRSDHR